MNRCVRIIMSEDKYHNYSEVENDCIIMRDSCEAITA